MLGVLTADCAVLITNAYTLTIFGNNSYHPVVIWPSITLGGRHHKMQFCLLTKGSKGLFHGYCNDWWWPARSVAYNLGSTLLGEYLIGGFDPLCWFLFVIYDRQHCATLLLVGFFRQC